MHASRILWAGLCLIAILAAAAAKHYAYFPGDVALEKAVQALFSGNIAWAEAVSRTAEFPWILLILAFTLALSLVLGRWPAALLTLLSFIGMWVLGTWLGPVIARPRPSPLLVQVVRPWSGSSFPSLFALRYAATFGFLAVLALDKATGVRRGVLVSLGCGLLIVGFLARVALAAHWPSDVIISYYYGVLWAAFLIRFLLPRQSTAG